MGAWQGARCVGTAALLSCIPARVGRQQLPGYGRTKPLGWPLGWPLLASQGEGAELRRAVWGHSCFHVGFADPSTHRAIGPTLGRGSAQRSVALHSNGRADTLLRGDSARRHQGRSRVQRVDGCLPWTSYARMGFECAAQEEDGAQLPWWTKEAGASPLAMEQVQEALRIGCVRKTSAPDSWCCGCDAPPAGAV